jgi:hypothetical protein
MERNKENENENDCKIIAENFKILKWMKIKIKKMNFKLK